jgi:hypothetical protein
MIPDTLSTHFSILSYTDFKLYMDTLARLVDNIPDTNFEVGSKQVILSKLNLQSDSSYSRASLLNAGTIRRIQSKEAFLDQLVPMITAAFTEDVKEHFRKQIKYELGVYKQKKVVQGGGEAKSGGSRPPVADAAVCRSSDGGAEETKGTEEPGRRDKDCNGVQNLFRNDREE